MNFCLISYIFELFQELQRILGLFYLQTSWYQQELNHHLLQGCYLKFGQVIRGSVIHKERGAFDICKHLPSILGQPR
jgi:hypothetical protein